MKPANYPITIFIGRKFYLQFEIINTLGDPYDLTGCSVDVDVKDEAGGTVLIALDAAVTTASAGLVTISKAHAGTASLTPQRGTWDILITNASGDKLAPCVGGPVEIRYAVTD